ncbi:MAG: DNA polymerase III subunit alpha [Phycisphaerae bacterium]|nr:DNA polymerase III subunit alpha [Phycisphaerae bacterium]
MAHKGFTHLHLHTQYSLLDGAIGLGALFSRCKELEMDAVAITDHGNMFGAIEFYTKALAAGVKPIIGIEAYIAPGSRLEKGGGGGVKENAYHLVLLAENVTGYRNLLKLSSIGFTEGFYYRPRIDKEILAQFSEGLICTTACIGGEVPAMLLQGDEEKARQAVENYLKIFGEDRFFIELQHHEPSDLPDLSPALIDLARKTGVPLVVTNDVHFLRADDYEAHNALCCISTGKKVTDPTRMTYPPDVYMKTSGEMRAMFAHVEEACDNTLRIAERCNVEIDLKSRHAPKYTPSDGGTPEAMLTRLVEQGAKKRYGRITDEIRQRMERELEVIEGKGFSSYFLIVWDFCNYAAENNIPVGARGSAVGTLVGYCLGICDVDPIKYDLLFERFMDPERNEMPDIDIDICQDGRARALEYVRQKYGQIAQIITFGTMKAKAVIRDVCRVLDVPLAEADRLAKLVPNELKMTLDKALEIEPDLKKACDENEQTRKVIEIGKRLEGLTRHASVHACGVVIADEPLTDYLPLYKTPGSDDLVTQFEGPTVEQVGLLKMDFLGLRTLSVIERAIELAREAHGVKIDIESIDKTDQKVLGQVFGQGRTKGVFQFESGGMQDLLMKLKPDRIEDLIAANALYRPGPMALIPDFIERKHGARWDVPHAIMREVLEETFGIMIYQEQVMRICNRLGDIPLREAYTLIKAIGKKKLKVIAKEKERFIKGCTAKGLKAEQAEHIFDLIEKFAGYGFNKSHATRYSFIAYQTAWLKYYYPVEFMAALLTYEMGNTDKVVEYIGESKEMGIEVLPPDINESFTDFTVVYSRDHDHKTGSGVIRFGLAAVKGVGEKAVEQIIAARQQVGRFRSLYHFCEHVDLRAANKQVMEALIKAGAFDNLGGSRAQMMAGLEKAMQVGASMQADLQKGQMNFFGAGGFGGADAREHETLPKVAPWSEMQMLTYEKDVLGFFVTMNPLSRHAETINVYSTADTSELGAIREGAEIVIGGMVTKIRQIVTRNGKNAGAKMAVFELEDLQGKCEVVLFPKMLEQCGHRLAVDKILFVKGTIDCRRENPNILCDELIEPEEVLDKLAATVWLELHPMDVTADKLACIRNLCATHRGLSPLRITLETASGYRIRAVADTKLSVRPDEEFFKKLEAILGGGKVRLQKRA